MNKSNFAFFSFMMAILMVSIVLLTALAAIETSASDAPAADKKVVLVIADYLDIGDIDNMSFLRSLASESYLAVISNRQPGKASAVKSKLMIGAGKGLELGTDMAAGGSEESFRGQYRISSGQELAEGILVYSDIFKLLHRNETSENIDYIGYLGDMVNFNNGRTCVLGNADTNIENRGSLLVAMDGDGLTDSGETGGVIKEDVTFPFGKRTDYNKLAELYKQYLPASSFLVIDTGDMERLEAFRQSMSEAVYEGCRQHTLKRIDSFIKELVGIGGFDTLIFISTYPAAVNADNNDKLTPAMVYCQSAKGGLLYSSNTRHEGIILNTDITSFIAQKLGYAETSEISEISRGDSLYYLKSENNRIVRNSKMRTPVLTTYAVFIILSAVIVFLITTITRTTKYFNAGRFGSVISGMVLVIPLVFLYLPLIYKGDKPILYISCAAAIAALVSTASKAMLRENAEMNLLLCSIVFFGLAIDIVMGSPLIRQSVLGYDPEIGARFYGIGNEYAGVFIGSSLAAAGGLQELIKKPCKLLSAAVYITCTMLLGLGFLGANFGGTLAGAAGYILAYYQVNGIKFNKENTFIATAILFITAALVVTIDYFGGDSRSHVGRLVKETGANGAGVVISTVRRKITMNLRLIRSTIWTKVLLSIILTNSFMFYRPVRLLKRLFRKMGYMKYSWMGIVTAAAAGLVLNDSGIVLAATVTIYAAFTILNLCMEERNRKEDEL